MTAPEPELETAPEPEPEPGRVDAALRWALGPVPAIRLESFRWALSLALLVYTLAWALDAREWLTPAGYHMSGAASYGLQLPVPLLGPRTVILFLVVYVGAMVGILLDLRPRLCSFVVFAGLLYVTTADRLAAFSMNKLALVAWLILLLAPWPSAAEQRGGEGGEGEDALAELRSAWPLRILQASLLIQYVGAGICKLRGDWLSGAPVLWLQVQGIYMTPLSAWMVRELPVWAWAGLQHGALAFELLAPLLFCVARLRPVAFAWGLAMHLAIGLMMYRVGFFSFFVVTYYLLFVDERVLRTLLRRVTPEVSRRAGVAGRDQIDRTAGG
ncbi:Vitamin K-dependent gamma-carboxylase [Enhygromyxa salina]|uniref:Vitamin K-dependent gamma-carboxylase n=1 Tax=Enhygromyxa salina TaxID=215803 RepID=A0A2S9XFY8_9BACT|nr:HTTM domain-containing protein [Enhygromyxa salina]PRP91747.1 Vitamin K-dependent gamma-carboxylase [Enhygromyxa salina]